jgi:cation diffusion facilitator family transporter
MKYAKCIECGEKTAWVTAAGNIILAVLMGITGVIGCSHALVADGILEAVDIIISLVVLGSLRFGDREPDRDHPYGHGKVEFITVAVVAIVITFAILFIFKDAVDEINTMVSGSFRPPKAISLFVALVSIYASEQLSRLNSCAGRELQSLVLTTNAVYNRFNAFTSALVVAAIIGAMAGFRYLDPAVVIIIGVIMIKTLIEVITKAYAGLMDTGFPPKVSRHVETIAKSVKGVEKVQYIKARTMGRRFLVNLCIEVSPSLTVAQSYGISEMVKEKILFQVENIDDVQMEIVSLQEE